MGDTPKTRVRKSRAKPIAPAVFDDPHLLRHTLVTSRALLRKKRLNPVLRERLVQNIALLEARAKELGVVARGWRAYPSRDGGGLTFGTSIDATGKVDHIAPPEVQRRKSRPHEGDVAAKDGGEMMDNTLALLEQSIAELKK